jgi:hypothetical protein
MMELVSRRSNFYDIEMRYAVTCPTNQSFDTFLRISQCAHRSYPCKHLDGNQFVAIFLEAFPERFPLQLH